MVNGSYILWWGGVCCILHNLLYSMSFNGLIFVCVSSYISPLIFAHYNMAAHFSVLSVFCNYTIKVLK